MTTNLTFVTGGTGKTGRRVAQRLVACGLPVRIGSRTAEPPFDWDEPLTWPTALAGADAVYVAYYPDLATQQAADRIRAFTELAASAGVRRIVLLSGRGEPEVVPAEDAVRDFGGEWTIMRCSWLAQNFSEDFLRQSVLDGELVLPTADVPEPFVDAEDVADVAVAALTEPGHAGQTYELTGPRLLTFAEAAADITAASGRELRYRPVSGEEFAAALRAGGLPAEFVEFFGTLFTRVLDGRNAHLTDDIKQALGREARDFAAYADKAAASGAWDG